MTFLQKLASKGQSPELQTAAAEAVRLCQKILRAKTEGPQVTEASGGGKAVAWAEVSSRIKEEIRIRQYRKSIFSFFRTSERLVWLWVCGRAFCRGCWGRRC